MSDHNEVALHLFLQGCCYVARDALALARHAAGAPMLNLWIPTSLPSERASGGQIRRDGSLAPLLPRWEHFSHDADIGLVGLGPTKAEAFRQAAIALTAVVTDPEWVSTVTSIDVVCHAPDDELLLVEWLNTLIYEMAVRSMLFGDYSVEIADGELHATARGEPVDPERHEPAVEIKGTTMTALRVARVPGGWRAQCVVDV